MKQTILVLTLGVMFLGSCSSVVPLRQKGDHYVLKVKDDYRLIIPAQSGEIGLEDVKVWDNQYSYYLADRYRSQGYIYIDPEMETIKIKIACGNPDNSPYYRLKLDYIEEDTNFFLTEAIFGSSDETVREVYREDLVYWKKSPIYGRFTIKEKHESWIGTLLRGAKL